MTIVSRSPSTSNGSPMETDVFREGSLYPDGSGQAPILRSPRKQLIQSPFREVTPNCERKSPAKKIKGKNLTHYFKTERPKRGRIIPPKFLTRSKSRQLFNEQINQN